MAITNKGELKTEAVYKWARSELTSRADALIAQAEGVLTMRMPELRGMEGAPFALDADTDTNWLLTNYPLVYLYALMVEGFVEARNDAAASLWQGRLDAAIEEVKWIDARETSNEPLAFDPGILPRDIEWGPVDYQDLLTLE